jgi:hypothetical protein
VDPKTLRLWLQAAQLSCCLHPEDARKKCLTFPQLQQLAERHGRPLPSALLHAVASPACAPAKEQGNATPSQEPEAGQQLRLLQQQVSTLQAQVTELALLLVRASLAQACPPATSDAALPATPGGAGACAGPTARHTASAPVTAETPRALPTAPVRSRTRSRALPLIQVRADGSVVAIAPNEGVLSLVPDSPAWFAWLSSLTAFSFEGQEGRFSATRKFRHGERVQSWNVHRSMHGRSCTLYLGLTPTLTLARLQAMALTVHTRLTAL